MTHEFPTALVTRLADELAAAILSRSAGHCVRVDDMSRDDALAVAEELIRRSLDADVHVLSEDTTQRPAEVQVDRAIELRNRKARPLLLLVPARAGHAASSLDNSFEPLPLVSLFHTVSERLEKELGTTEIGSLITSVRRALGRARRAESWARFLGTVSTSPTPGEVGRQLWQVGLVPDLGADSIESRLQRNAKAVAAIARPSKPTARVMDRLINADVSGSEFRQQLQAFLELQEAGRLADPVSWTRMIGEQHPGEFTFEQWPTVLTLASELTRIKITPFLRANGSLDPTSKLKLGDDGQLYCEVATDHPGHVAVKWTTEPAMPADVRTWQAEVLPPADLRWADTSPVARTKVSGDKRKTTLSVSATEDDLATSTLFVVRLRAFDADGNELQLDDEAAAEAESDQFVVRLKEFEPPPPAARSGAASLPLAVLGIAIDSGGDLAEGTPVWDESGQAFDIRIGKRRTLIRASRILRDLQRTMAADPNKPMAFDARSPLGEAIPAEEILRRPLMLPPALADRRSKLLAALAPPRDAVEIVDWSDGLRKQAREYVQAYDRALTANTDSPEVRKALLSLDTLSVSVTTSDAEFTGLVLLSTHPLRLAWLAAHDQLLRGWAAAVTEAGRSKQDRARQVDRDMAARLSPANLPFIMVTPDGKPLVYAEELTHGAALYLPPDVAEPQSAADTICRALDITRASAEQMVSAQSLTERFRSYRIAHPGSGAMRAMAVNPGTGAMLAQALRPLVLRLEAGEDNEVLPDDPQRLEIIAYTDNRSRSYTDPVGDLRQLQRAIAAGEARRSATTHLAAPLGLAVRDLSQLEADREGHHLAVVQDLARSQVTVSEAGDGRRASATTAFQDLLTPLVAERATGTSATWYVSPALKAKMSGHLEADIVDAHRAHQAAVAAHLGNAPDMPALQISLKAPDMTRLRSAHDRADWVITLDRGIGPEIFEEAAPDPTAPTPYLLDYTPDFLEGLGKKLTVTTIHHDEVRRVLSEALRSLDLGQDEPSVSRVLNHLSLVSGRLALRLLRDTSLSVEAVSLAAVMAHLSRRGQLEDLIVVPVDAHTEIFGVRQRAGEEQARRCDLLLVQVTQRSMRIECVEVKGRRAAQLPQSLADSIVDQLELTERLLQQQFFATDPPRIDAALQRARLASLLHYYADRSARFGHITPAKLADIHRNIDRHEQSVSPAITKTGYVISSDGSGFPARHRDVLIRVLTPNDLGEAGFTTLPETWGQQAAHAAAPPRVTPTASANGSVSGPASRTAITAPADPAAVPSASASEGAPEVATATPSPERAAQPPPSPDDVSLAQGSVAPGPGVSTTSARVEEDRQDGTGGVLPEEEAAPGSSNRLVSVELGADAGGTPVVWNVSTKGSPHAFILGIPGQGKSVTTRRIIREFAGQALPSLALDFHGDMAAEPPVGAQVIDASAGLQFSPFELAALDSVSMKKTAWEVAEIVGYVCGLGDIQLRHVYDGLQRAYMAAQGVPTMAQFADAVEETEREARGRNARDRLLPLTDFGLFADNPTGTFVDSWRNGAVVDLSGLGLESVQLAGGAFILRKIYREMFGWEQSGVMRLAIVLDEAHRLAKDVTLPKLMKEGRKYGVSVVVASQGMADFHRDVIANAGTKIVFRTNFPDSKATANFLRGRGGQDLSQQIEQLSVGSAYVSTPDHVNARRVYMYR